MWRYEDVLGSEGITQFLISLLGLVVWSATRFSRFTPVDSLPMLMKLEMGDSTRQDTLTIELQLSSP
jgi:hypothetical protein